MPAPGFDQGHVPELVAGAPALRMPAPGFDQGHAPACPWRLVRPGGAPGDQACPWV